MRIGHVFPSLRAAQASVAIPAAAVTLWCLYGLPVAASGGHLSPTTFSTDGSAMDALLWTLLTLPVLLPAWALTRRMQQWLAAVDWQAERSVAKQWSPLLRHLAALALLASAAALTVTGWALTA